MFAHLRSGETRPATILMSDVSGFTALSSNADPEWVFNLINQVLSELVECLVGHGAHIDKYVGDEVVALFGVPVAQERSAERALLAALVMQERIRALNDERRFGNVQLQIHTGINVGRVIVGPIGHGAHTDYTVIGESVNVAKRLEDAAPPGEIYISSEVRDAVGDGFIFEEVGHPARIFSDCRKRVIDFVGDSRGHLSDCRKLFVMQQLGILFSCLPKQFLHAAHCD